MIARLRLTRRGSAIGAALALSLIVAIGAVATAAELAFDIALEHGRVADNMRLIRVKQGDAVRLRLTSDRPITVHLHGYDIERRIAAGGSGELSFTAYATGRFPIHPHQPGQGPAGHPHDDAPLVTVEVYPR